MNPKSRVLAAVAIASILLILCGTYLVHGHSEKEGVIFEIEESSDGLVKFINVTGDYGFDEYMKVGSYDLELDDLCSFLADNVTDGRIINGLIPANCSTFTVPDADSDGYLAARNFDYRYVEPGVVFTHPENGYSSVCMVDLRMFSDTGESLDDMRTDTRLNAAPYLSLDGMNERRVFVSVNAIHNGPQMTMDEPGKVPMFTTCALRLILDNAASTQEAVDLVSQFNLRSPYPYHIFVCDNTGDSRCIEVLDGRMHVTDTPLMTNHYLLDVRNGSELELDSMTRFEIISEALESKPSMTTDEALDVLKNVKQEEADQTHYTRWSAIYNLDSFEVTLYTNGQDGKMDYSNPYEYSCPLDSALGNAV